MVKINRTVDYVLCLSALLLGCAAERRCIVVDNKTNPGVSDAVYWLHQEIPDESQNVYTKDCNEASAREEQAAQKPKGSVHPLFSDKFDDNLDTVAKINDVKQLSKMYSEAKNLAAREAIVFRLNELGGVDSLPERTLISLCESSTRKEVKLAAINGIEDWHALMRFAKARYDPAITVAAFKKIDDADLVLRNVWGNIYYKELFKAYVEAYGDDDELLRILKNDIKRLTPDMLEVVNKKATSPRVLSALNELKVQAVVDRFSERDVEDHLFDKLTVEIEGVGDPSFRTAIAECLLDRHMKLNNGRIHDVVSFDVMPDGGLKYWDYLGAEWREKFFANVFAHGNGNVAFGVALLKAKPKEAQQREIADAMARGASSVRINFEGFYIGMSWGDFCRVSLLHNQIPYAYSRNGIVSEIVFSRRNRYGLFEKEDGEFWSSFLKKYVPSQSTRKSLSETIDGVLDDATWDYSEGYDTQMEERCFVYKSMKYGTKIKFGLDSGRLILEKFP